MKYIKPGVKGLSMIRQVSFIVAVLSVCSFAAPDTTGSRISELEQKVDDILSVAGIQFGGEFRAQFLLSGLDEEKPGVSNGHKISESVDVTSVDFSIVARPNDIVGGKVIFRMHQNWQNFFSDVGNPITTRWVGISGNVNNMFLYDIGDYKQKYSPLTLYTPEVDVEFEPEIFAKQRRYALSEDFLGDNQRLLQGINFTFAAQIDPLFKKFYAQAFGNRLRLSQTNANQGSQTATSFEMAREMDRYAAGFNTDMEIIEDLKLGGTFLSIFDAPSTSNRDQIRAESEAEVRMVGAVRGGIGTEMFTDSDVFGLSLTGELAFSGDRDSSEVDEEDNVTYWWTKGTAVKVDLLGDIKLGDESKLDINAGITINDEEYRNDLAQSPSFFGQRIMNVENDFPRDSVNLYSTFDALYRTVFKYAPSDANQFVKTPYRKSSYTNGILSMSEIESFRKDISDAYPDTGLIGYMNSRFLFDPLFDPALQLVMPFGPATPNRVGFDADVSASLFDKGVEAKASLGVYNEMAGADIDSLTVAPKTSFVQFGGGASIDFSSFLGALSNPLRISGGIKLSMAQNDGLDISLAKKSVNSSLLNVGLYWNFYKRFSLLAGYQQIGTIMQSEIAVMEEITNTQKHWAVGLEYKIGKTGGVVTGSIGQTMVSYQDNMLDKDYSQLDFTQWQPELFLTVPF